MKFVFYFLTTFFSLLGALALLRTIELLLTGEGMLPAQFFVVIIMLLLAGGCLKKARNIMTGMDMGRRRQIR
jgi:hypothetical protein